MNCHICKNPTDINQKYCEWCNSSLIGFVSKPEKPILFKGEGFFKSVRIKKTYCFIEMVDDEVRFFNFDQELNIVIPRKVIFNILLKKRLVWMHLIPVLGTIVRFFILLFSKYRKGVSIITSKSGENIVFIRNINYQSFVSKIQDFK
jgi:hypothetical protein